ncbi:MAG: hypothetical protein APR63_05920 [Desulfuromonas sp. SDB]|nr:MAG: hypothetical protein APR63_05920 [Desulfuromonas sp. SDB]
MKKVIVLFIILSFSFSLAAQHHSSRYFETVIIGGGGFANNLRLADWQNLQYDAAKIFLGGNLQEEEKKEAVVYSSIRLEQRFYTGNLVFAPAIAYYQTTRGEREVIGNTGSYYNQAELKTFSLQSTIYYRIGNIQSNYVLLGGGLGYYQGTLKLEYGFNDSLSRNEGSGWTMGWHSGMEYNHSFGNIVLKAGLISRFAEIYELEVENNQNTKIYDSGASLTGISLYAGLGYRF